MDKLRIKKLRENAVLPQRATEGSAGADLCACIESSIVILPGTTQKIPTGIAIEMGGREMAALVFGRSGLGINHGIVPANAVGLIDSDYRGEIIVGLHNSSQKEYTINPGDRIAQLVIIPVLLPQIQLVDDLGQTQRGAGGLGSTGN